MNQSDNIVSHLLTVRLRTETSNKTGNPYTYLEQTWNRPNGKTYKQRVFLNDDAKALIEDSEPISGSNEL